MKDTRFRYGIAILAVEGFRLNVSARRLSQECM